MWNEEDEAGGIMRRPGRERESERERERERERGEYGVQPGNITSFFHHNVNIYGHSPSY